MKFALLGNLQTSGEEVTEEEINLITLQLFSSILFVITTLISTALTYDLYLKKTGGQPLFDDKTATQIDALNRTVILALIVIFLYINISFVNITKEKGEDTQTAELQVVTAILTLVAGSIALYVAYQQLNKDFNISNLESMEV